MSIRFSSISVLLIAVVLSACASAPVSKVSFQPQSKQTIKRVALVGISEPVEYRLIPYRSIAASTLMVLGPIGGALSASVDIGRLETASSQFTKAVLPYKPNISSVMLDQMEAGLKRQGFEVVRVPQPARTADGKSYDINKIEGEFDAILIGELSGGYSAGQNGWTPRLAVTFSLVTKASNEPLFSDSYLYCADKIRNMVQVVPDTKYVFETEDALYADIKLAAEALNVGATKLAERVLEDL